MEGFAGVSEIEIRLAGTTVSVAVSLNAPAVAVIVTVPAAMVLASPLLSMLATVVSDDDQVTPLERSCDEPSV